MAAMASLCSRVNHACLCSNLARDCLCNGMLIFLLRKVCSATQLNALL